MKKFKGFIAALTALVTVASSASVVAFAQSGGLAGDGKVEGVVNKEIFNVVLPTVSESDTTFDFILDPQGLIAATASTNTKYSGKTFEASKYLFFNNVATDKTNDYSSSSDKLTAYNLSTKAVDLTIKGTVTGADGITFVSTTPAANAAEIQLQLDVDGTPKPFATSDSGTSVEVTKKLDEIESTNFEVKYNSDGTYSYALISGKDESNATVGASKSNKAVFKLIGEASKNDDGKAWANLKDVAPKVDITWEIKSPFSSAPSATTSVAANSTALVMPYDLGSGDDGATAVTKVEYWGPNDSNWAVASSSLYTIANNQITWNANCSAYFTANSKIRITFNDKANTSVIVTVQ